MKNNIEKHRTAKGLSQEELGKIIGIQKPGVSKLESGKIKNIKPATIKALAEFFGCTMDDLFKLEQPEVDNISGKIHANGLIKLFDEAVGGINVRNENAIKTLQVDDDSNEPALYKNWLVRYKDRKEGVDPEAIDLPAVVKLKDGTMLIRKLQKGSRPDRWHLTTLAGGKLMADAEVEWAAAVHYVLPKRA